MSFTRARALRSLQNGLRQSNVCPALRSNASRRTQVQAKRFASSEHGEYQQKSDIPWLIGALVVTPPGVWYLWPAPHSDDHHADHDDHGQFQPEQSKGSAGGHALREAENEAAEESDDESAEESKEESSDDKSEKKEKEEGDKGDDKPTKEDESAKEDKPTKEDNKEEDKPAKKDSKGDVPAEGEGVAKPQQGGGNVDGVTFKGGVKADSDGAKNTVKIESDSKGAVKKRVESGLGKNLGPGHEQEGSDRDFDTQDGKQKGLSNTQTRHSTPIHESSEKSKKPDGTPETAKSIGTVD